MVLFIWLIWFIWFVSFVWLDATYQMNQINQSLFVKEM